MTPFILKSDLVATYPLKHWNKPQINSTSVNTESVVGK